MTDTESSVVIGVDIGGTKIMAGLVTTAGDLLHVTQIDTPSTPTAILTAVQDLCQSLSGRGLTVRAVGIGTAGMVDTTTGQVIYANENLPDWTGTHFGALPIAYQFPLVIENDVYAMAYGEAVLGAGQAYKHLLCVTVGTGVGGAIVLDGKLWHGATYAAGGMGYMVANWEDDTPVQLDQFVSGPAIESAYQAQCQLETRLSLKEIAARADQGDEIAAQVIRKKAAQFGAILGGYTTSINPQAVVIGGGVPQIGVRWWDPMETAFREATPPPARPTKLMRSSLGVEAVMFGAAMLAWRKA